MNKEDKMILELFKKHLWSSELYCDRFHHPKKDQHGYNEPCPIEERYKYILEGD